MHCDGGGLSGPAPSAAPILIAGAGIGGLAAAIALADLGLASHVVERRPGVDRAGAGIQLGPNAMHCLARLGVADALAAESRPAALRVRDAVTARRIQDLPLGNWMRARHGAPYVTMHRADLIAALMDRAADSPLISFTWAFDVSSVEESEDAIQLTSRSDAVVKGRALIGADGMRSQVRLSLFPDPRYSLVATGRTASRVIIDASTAPSGIDRENVTLWLGPSLHGVTYPIRAGRELALVIVTGGNATTAEWDGADDDGTFHARLAGLAPPLADLADRKLGWRSWRLADARPFPAWSHGKAVLLGDAAHPVAPHFAQGGALALEDAVTLAATLRGFGGDLPRAVQAFEAARRTRCGRVQAASRRNGGIYQASGAFRQARDIYLALRSGAAHMSAFDWLYGWRPPDLGQN